MLTKTWNPDTSRYDVLFDLPSELEIDHAAVVGEFNDWDSSADPMRKGSDGRWVATLALEPGTSHRFRYHLGEDRWENDWNADDYVDNEFGGSDSVVRLPDAPSEPPAVKQSGGAGKKAAPRKTAAEKTGTKKAGTKKAGAKKTAAKKTAAKKTGAKKAAAKKAAGKKAATKKQAP